MRMANVNLGTQFESFVAEQVALGRYQNSSEVVRAGLRLLQEHEARVKRLQQQIAEGEADLAAGRVHSYPNGEALADDIINGSRDD